MDQFSRRFFSQVQVLQTQLESLLSKDWGPSAPTSSAQTEVNQRFQFFEVQTDLSQLETLGWSLPTHEPFRSQVLFERLSPYFDSGLCFSLQHDDPSQEWIRWGLRSAFHHGQKYPLLPQDTDKQIALPRMSLTEIRKVAPDFLLSELGLGDLVSRQDLQTLVIRPAGNRLWILFTGLPDVFLKSHIMTIQDRCLKLLADFPEGE